MRIQFSLACQKGIIIPINYQSEVSNWIFTVLSKGGAELNSWMQARGFDLSSRSFKLFTFSPLAIFPYEMDQVRQEFKLLGNQVKINVSIYLDPAFEQQIVNLFRQTPLSLGTLEGKSATFEVKHWQVLPRPQFREHMNFKTTSPISIRNVVEEKASAQNPTPDNELYDVNFFTLAVQRFKAAKQFKSLVNNNLLDPSFAMSYRLLGQSKSRLIHLKPNPDNITQIRGFMFEYEVSMPYHLLEFCYFAGFGEYNYLGFGYVDIK